MPNGYLHKRVFQESLDRRDFIGTSIFAAAAFGMSGQLAHAASSASEKKIPICAFIKFLQSLSYDEMAEVVADIGFDGVESTVRRKGHVDPEKVEDQLPEQMEAVKKHGLDFTIMTTDVIDLTDPLTERVLRTGAKLGIKKYRMGFHRYDKNRGVMEQLDEIRPKLVELAAFNKELGLSAVYQNHCGAKYVGSVLWDLQYLLKDIPKEQIGVAFDIRHATVEGGTTWPLHYDIMKPHIGALFAKDFNWNGKKPEHVPMGTGRVDKKFYQMHLASGIECPISLHVEYLKKGDAEENAVALRRDLKVLKSWLNG